MVCLMIRMLLLMIRMFFCDGLLDDLLAFVDDSHVLFDDPLVIRMLLLMIRMFLFDGSLVICMLLLMVRVLCLMIGL